MGFADDLKEFQRVTINATHEVFVNSASGCHSSVVNGDARTGAPGSPVRSGLLKSSWQLQFSSPNEAEISTNVEYARSIEDGISYAHGGTPLTLRSEVGGFHSVALTVANFDRIVESEAAKIR